jgi:hypothetical protein
MNLSELVALHALKKHQLDLFSVLLHMASEFDESIEVSVRRYASTEVIVLTLRRGTYSVRESISLRELRDVDSDYLNALFKKMIQELKQ